VSDCGRHGLTLIAFIGSVFSPYYAWSRARDPYDHCTLNVCLYGANATRWAMTERPARSTAIAANRFRIAGSSVQWSDGALAIDFDEIGAPIPFRIRGRVRIATEAIGPRRLALDGTARHWWWPIAPHARITVEIECPRMSWSGSGYLDCNRGSEPLEAGFAQWQWSRAPVSTGTIVQYDLTERSGRERTMSLHIDPRGTASERAPLAAQRLPRTLWGIRRTARADTGTRARVVRTLEDTPFYARSMLSTRIDGETVPAMHESLSLTRFSSPIVKCMLPFRMPRLPGRLRGEPGCPTPP
jgi:carotenoid 1,2-hydratase